MGGKLKKLNKAACSLSIKRFSELNLNEDFIIRINLRGKFF